MHVRAQHADRVEAQLALPQAVPQAHAQIEPIHPQQRRTRLIPEDGHLIQVYPRPQQAPARIQRTDLHPVTQPIPQFEGHLLPVVGRQGQGKAQGRHQHRQEDQSACREPDTRGLQPAEPAAPRHAPAPRPPARRAPGLVMP
jgi:hypothetical protein